MRHGDRDALGAALQFRLRKGEARRLGIQDFQFYRDDYFVGPELAAPRRFFATTGLSGAPRMASTRWRT